MNKWEDWEKMKRQWTDQLVTVDPAQPHLHRFTNLTGRVVTVNGSMMCIVDFQDGGWYDIAPDHLTRCADQQAAARQYNTMKNSAQRLPHRQA